MPGDEPEVPLAGQGVRLTAGEIPTPAISLSTEGIDPARHHGVPVPQLGNGPRLGERPRTAEALFMAPTMG